MNTALKNMRVGDLSASQLEQAFEKRLVRDGLDCLANGETIKATSGLFDSFRQLARNMAAKQN